MKRTPLFALAAALLSFTSIAHADWQPSPKSSHQLYETYGLFIDNQTTVVYYGAGRIWGALGGAFAIVGNPDTAAHPQLIAFASANASLTNYASNRFSLDEVDLRTGAAFEFALDPAIRLSLGMAHTSGHVADGAVDPTLLEPTYTLGYDSLFIRGIYDLGPYARAGVTFQPIVRSSPTLHVFSANEFLELFPLGAEDSRQKPSPYLSLAMEQGGTEEFGYVNTFNLQLGLYMGNHFSNEHVSTSRVVVGLYTGADPRLKYFQFEDWRITFGYLGFMLDI